MVNWKRVYTKQANKDASKLAKNNLKNQAMKVIDSLEQDPDSGPYEKLVGDLKGVYSRRVSIKHRVVYQVYKKERTIKIIRMWSHYE